MSYLIKKIISYLFIGLLDISTGNLACVAHETKPRYSPSANQRPNACSDPPRVTRVFYNGFYLAYAFGCFFVHRDWTSGSRGTMVTLSMNTRYTKQTRRRSQNYLERPNKCKSFTEMLSGVANAMVCIFSLPL